MVFAVATAPFGGGLLAALVAETSMYDYSRDLERGADSYGFDVMSHAGYAPGQCSELWHHLSQETAHSDIEDVRRAEARGSIFKTHPLTSERIAALARMPDTASGQGDVGEDRYRKAIAPFIDRWAKDEVHRGDYGESLFLIDRMIAAGQKLGVLYFERGEALRLRRKPGDVELALETYHQATAYADAPPQAWRELGELNLKLGHTEAARAAFSTYIENNPKADDRAMIETTLSRL
jgi:predicted Zn-dependent protease